MLSGTWPRQGEVKPHPARFFVSVVKPLVLVYNAGVTMCDALRSPALY